MTLPLGKLPPVPTKPALALAPHLTAVPTTPSQRDWLSKVPSWPMYGNDKIGDCVWAMIGHAIKAWTTYAGTPVEVPEAAVIKGYSDVTGYDPKKPETDQGTVLQDALSYWRKVGVAGHKILAFAKVDHRDPIELQTAINIFGAVMIGMEFPRSAMDQFDAGQPWTVVRRDGGIEGGHAVHFGRYTRAANGGTQYALTTWGRVQEMSPDFALKYLDEAWVVITSEWLTSGGTTLDGVDLHGLGEELSRLTGEPNPFPTTTPPAPATADEALAAALRANNWVQAQHYGATGRVAQAARTWLAVRGL